MISYIGGKSKISTWLRNFIPHDIEIYVEPFAGMMWLFFKMELKNYPNLKTIVYNDVNPLNVNLFLCLKDYNRLYEVTSNKPIEDVDLFNQLQGRGGSGGGLFGGALVNIAGQPGGGGGGSFSSEDMAFLMQALKGGK